MSGDATPDAPLDARLVAWMAALLLVDEHARLIESGADSDARVPLAKVFVDLSATRCVGRLPTKGSALLELVGIGDGSAEAVRPMWLLLGGPGAGKSTVTAMAAQIQRALCVSARPEAVPKTLQERVGAVIDGLRSAAASRVALAAEGALPVRVNLPAFARRLADSRGAEAGDALFEHLAATMSADLRAVGHDAECRAAEMRAMLRAAGRVIWLFDGLDEVPTGDLRAAVSRALHEVIAVRRPGDRAVVTTRPQGYGGEFDDFPTMELDALEWLAAMDFCERLVKATGRPVEERELRETLTREFNRPEVQALARSPLHAAIVASFIERQDELPRSRWVLFERYFNVLFDRELRKLSAAGVKSEQRARILELHARAGLALHVRAQAQPAATLSVRELRAMMVVFYQEEDPDEEHAEEKAGQLLRFASERLVLLLRVVEGGYAFGIRPLQEFFAARALWTLDAATLRKRLDAVVVAPHWANVVALLASGAAVVAVDAMSWGAASVLVEVCEALNDGADPLRRTAPLAFTDAHAWEDDYHFAPPHIAMQPPTPSPPRLLSIDALTNVRLFRDTPIVGAPFPTPAPDRGQWIVLIGENGVGKTTLLRALALALVSPEVAAKQLHSRLPLVRNGGPASIALTLSSGLYRAEVSRVDGGSTETVNLVGDPPSERPWVVGYGVRRGGALGEEGRIVDWALEGNLHTLFERQPALVVAQDWLLKLDRRVQRERAQAQGGAAAPNTPASDLWNAVVNALKRALEVTDITAGDDDVVYIEHGDFGRVRLESLSDGYLSTAGWIVDLIARWVRQREAEGDLLVGDILGQMTGLVLVDEVDLHLHPRWQMRVIDDLRRIFPRLTFVVTTHNPLTLQGARPGEVFVMSRGDGGRITLLQRDIQPGHDIDRVLLEQFGIEHTFDRETREWLREHRRLMVAGTPPRTRGAANWSGSWPSGSAPLGMR